MATLRRNVLTAKSRPKDLKEHEDGFIAANGIKAEPPVDPNSEVSGIVGQFNTVEFVTVKDISQKAFDITRLTRKAIKRNPALDMLARALGYNAYQHLREHLKTLEGVEYVQNLNFARNDLATVVQEVNEENREALQAIIDLLVPEIDLIYTLPDESEWLGQKPKADTRAAYVKVIQEFRERHLKAYADLSPQRRTAADIAFSIRYPDTATKAIRETRYYLAGHKSSLVREARKLLQRRYKKTPILRQD